MAQRDPRMLPGITANDAGNIGALAIVCYIAFALLVLIAGIVISAIDGGEALPDRIVDFGGDILGVGFVIAAGLAGVFLPVEHRKRRLELEAGYTSMLTEFNQYDGISSRTGQVVRPAVTRPAGVLIAGAFSTGMDLGAIPTGLSPLRIVLRSRPSALAIFGATAVLVVGVLWFASGTNTDAGPSVLSALAILLGFCGAILTLGFAFSTLPNRYYEKLLAQHFLDSRVVMGTTDNSDIVTELLALDSEELPGARARLTGYLVFAADSLVLVSRHRVDLLPYLVIPRARVSAAQLTTRSYGKTMIPAVSLTLTKDNGSSLKIMLELTVPGSRTRSKLSEQCQWVIDWASGRQPATT